MTTETPATAKAERTSIAGAAARVIERWMPDAFVIAVLLTVLTVGLAITVADYSPQETMNAWGDGFWNLLAFTNQIVLTLLFGHALAHTPPMMKAINWLASRPRTAQGAYLLVGFVSAVAAVFSWALCLVAGAILARRTARVFAERGIAIHYPLLAACGFVGFCIWHQGLASSIGLSIATQGHFMQDVIGIVPTSETIFQPWNLITMAIIVATLPFVMRRLAPRPEAARSVEDYVGAEHPHETEMDPDIAQTPAGRMENSRLIAGIAVAGGLYYLISHFIFRGQSLDLNTLNFCFLILGVALAGTPARYVGLIMDAARVCAPFLLQYPFYSGIAAIMAQSGLAQIIVNMFVSVSTPETLPIFTFFSGGLLNIFIPSGGGQWAIQGPIAMAAAAEIGADVPKTAMAIAMGDQWTSLIHPLSALPALAVAGLHIRDIMSYCLVALAFTGVIFTTVLIII